MRPLFARRLPERFRVLFPAPGERPAPRSRVAPHAPTCIRKGCGSPSAKPPPFSSRLRLPGSTSSRQLSLFRRTSSAHSSPSSPASESPGDEPQGDPGPVFPSAGSFRLQPSGSAPCPPPPFLLRDRRSRSCVPAGVLLPPALSGSQIRLLIFRARARFSSPSSLADSGSWPSLRRAMLRPVPPISRAPFSSFSFSRDPAISSLSLRRHLSAEDHSCPWWHSPRQQSRRPRPRHRRQSPRSSPPPILLRRHLP